ncbi:hypothetical protein G3O00_08545 [Burkholderia sp. Ac-20384]|uniref:hypothetical protein n=1 Tax=Burkholderia sp. Ac-20384 TaxID=2703902 RepID=UPI00197CBB17|nr:hypothetical protein [Burkholderia sp. Ac-20384]MBN3823667.1 hypothetical protein [Burkholderia sp. Ac-20384]
MSGLMPYVSDVFDFLKSVPNVVWSGIVGSLITVVGVLLTNVGLSRRHRQQLQHTATESALKRSHESAEKALDRKMQLRRDVYIPAIEGVFSALHALGSMADPSVPRADANKKYSEAIATIGKVNGVAEAKTVAVVSELLTLLLAMNFALSIKRGAIERSHGQWLANNGTVDRAVQEHGRWVQIQTSMLFEGPPDPRKWDFVQSQINFQQGQIDEWSRTRDGSIAQLQVAQIEFLKELATYQPQVTNLSTQASIALRTELAFADENLHLIEKVLTERGEKARQIVLDVIANTEGELAAIKR